MLRVLRVSPFIAMLSAFMLDVLVLSVTMLSVLVISVTILSVVMLNVGHFHLLPH